MVELTGIIYRTPEGSEIVKPVPARTLVNKKGEVQQDLIERVKQMGTQGLNRAQMATSLRIPRTRFYYETNNLSEQGILPSFPQHKGRLRLLKERVKDDVLMFRQQGMTYSQITETLGIKRSQVQQACRTLLNEGKLEPGIRENKTKPQKIGKREQKRHDLEVLDTQVRELREQGFSNNAIAQQLNRPFGHIIKANRRLIEAGEAIPRTHFIHRYGLNPSDIVQVEQMRANGLSTEEISKTFNIDESTTSKLILALEARNNAMIRKSDTHWLSQIQGLAGRGLNRMQIARDLNLSYSQVDSAVRSLIRTGKLESYGRVAIAEDLASRIIEMREKGSSLREIATILGISRTVTSNVLRATADLSVGVSQNTDTQIDNEKKPVSRTIPRVRRGNYRYGRNRFAVIKILNEAYSSGQSVSLTDIAGQLGIGRERVRQLYNVISRQQPVPKLQKTEAAEKRDQEKLAKANKLKEQAEKEKRFWEQIRALRSAGFSKRQMADKLGCSVLKVEHQISEMFFNGEVEYKRNILTEDELNRLRTEVKNLRQQGLDNQTIAQKLSIPVRKVGAIAAWLIRAGEINKIKSGRRPKNTS